jgi:hypothetical protein
MALLYDPLPKRNYIRLLEVRHKFLSRDDPICKFKVVCLDNCSHEYTAISYCWGNKSPVNRLRFSDGQSISLTPGLSSPFDSLRKNQRSFTLWVDAICINQNDVAEKSSQVPLMGMVYSCAKQVLLWLGEGNRDTQKAFRFMKAMSPSRSHNRNLEKDSSGLETLFAILEQPLFSTGVGNPRNHAESKCLDGVWK